MTKHMILPVHHVVVHVLVVDSPGTKTRIFMKKDLTVCSNQ